MTASDPPPSPELNPGSTAPSRRRGFPWIPVIMLALGGVGMAVVGLMPDLDRNMARWFLAAIPMLVILLLLIWFLLTPGFSGRVRLLGLLGAVLVFAGLKMGTRVDGTMDGTGLPRLVWKWKSARPSLATPENLPAAGAVQEDARLAQAADVPQFYGPDRDGRVTGAKLSGDWKTNPPKELWRQPVGEGWSAWAVQAGRAFTQEQRGEDELVSCYELLTGKLLWVHANKVRFSQWQSGDGPHATPALSGNRVYAYGATGLLSCLDATTGKLIWQRPVLEENKLENLEWGISASPLLVSGKVVVTGGHTLGPVLFAFDGESGEPVWKGGNDRATYASPLRTTLAGKDVILCQHGRALTAHDPETGSVVLEYPWGNEKWPKASQPVVVAPDRIFISAGYGMGCEMIRIKPAENGTLKAEEVWKNLKLKTQFNSPAVRGNHLYGLDDGRFSCLETETGERLWKEGRFASGQSLLVDDYALIQAESGSVHLAKASPDGFEELGEIEALSSKTWNHPVLAGRYLLVRNDREAVCYELPVVP